VTISKENPLFVVDSKTENKSECQSKDSVWYKDGLKFGCTQCGKCCTGAPGIAWVSLDEIQNIAEYLKIPINDFVRGYLRKIEGRWALLEDFENFDCIFLKDKKCSVYPVRPSQCRTFPWWQKNLESKEAWQEASRFCEGIRDDADTVSLDEIERNLKV
jgi:uncharacterized protein